MNNIIIKIEKGFVADVYCTEAVNVIVVDSDVIMGGETFEERMTKAVMMTVERRIRPEEIGPTVQSLVLECGRSTDGRRQERATTMVGTKAARV